jgi:hypothetical protein
MKLSGRVRRKREKAKEETVANGIFRRYKAILTTEAAHA